MRPPKNWMRLTAALAMVSVAPAMLVIEAAWTAEEVSVRLPTQEQKFRKAIAQLGQRVLSCASVQPGTGYLTARETRILFEDVIDATSDVNHPFFSDYLWMYKESLPCTAGLYAVYQASITAQVYLAQLSRHYDFCRDIEDHDDTDFREEEERSQARLNEHLTRLREFDRDLASARTLFAQDGPKLAALAWSLGILQVVGWGLLYFVIFPQQVRAWREKRAEKKAQARRTGS